jgi:hypothetical protein
MEPMYYIGRLVAYLTAVGRGQRNFQVRETSSRIAA